MTHQRDEKMSHHRLVLADLEMRHAQIAFLVLQNAFDRPAREGDVKPGFQFALERIPNEEPFLWKKELGVEHRAKARVVRTEREMNGDDAVGGLAESAAILALHTGRLRAGFRMAGVVDDADAFGIGMIACDDLLDAIAGAVMIPDIGVEKLLERARRQVVEQRNWLDALALEVAELPAHVMTEMIARFGPPETIGELADKLGKRRPKRENLIFRHP